VGPNRIVIVGAGLAGASAAFALRQAGFDGEVTLVGDERHPPYNRPGLSKEYLRGEDGFPDLLVRAAEDYSRARIGMRLGERALSIDPDRRIVTLKGNERLAYDRLLVATGGRNRRLEVPGTDLAGVLQLRTVDEADLIRNAAKPGCRALVVGMGFIGAEVAASLHQLGADVTVVARGPAPLASALGERVGAVLAKIHRGRGERLMFGTGVTAIEGAGRVERVVTASGQVLECDLVVVGIGIEPNVGLLREAGARIGDGVVVDEFCRTSLPDVYAAGDIADTPHPIFGRGRVEHWNNAYQQGQAAARSMLDLGRAYGYIHSFWSDQFDHSIEYVGLARAWDAIVFRGVPESGRFLGFYLQGGRLQAAVGLDRGGDPEDRVRGGELKKCIPLIRDQVQLDPVRLASEASLLGDAIAV
jgi:3-phenylpropionate/trans-cinnamate dioxygenase ferredoxin reductase component